MKDVKGVCDTQLPEGVRRLCLVLGTLFGVFFGVLLLSVAFQGATLEVMFVLAALGLVGFFLPVLIAKAWFWVREGFST